MNHILLITSSPRGADSLSTRPATEITQGLHALLGGPLTVRDLATDPLPYISSDYIQGRMVPTPVIFNESVLMRVGRGEDSLAIATEQAILSEARIAA